MIGCTRTVLVLTVACLAAACSRAPLTTAAVFADGMVLQRNTTAPLWGRCEPGQRVRVKASWLEREITTITDLQGVWVAHLPTADAGGPHSITIRGGGELELDDVWLGEVWLCAGGVDMEWRLTPDSAGRGGGVTNAPELTANADGLVRQFDVENSIAVFPRADCAGSWSVASPQTVAAFSSTAYAFATTLRRELNVPIGILNATYPGARAQAWMGEFHVRANQASLADAEVVDGLRANGVEVDAAQQAGAPSPLPPGSPTLVYNAMIVPLAPFALRGVVWRDGQADLDRAGPYHQYQRTLAQGLRDLWCEPRLPFYVAQLPTRAQGDETGQWATVREGQRRVLDLPHTGLVVTADLGPVDDSSARNDAEVGRRFALWALAKNYGREQLTPSGPLLRKTTVEGDRLRLQFDHAEGLRARAGALAGFEVAGADNKYARAEAALDGDSVVVKCAEVSAPRSVRYAFAAPERGNLTNSSGLPAASFRVVIEPAK